MLFAATERVKHAAYMPPVSRVEGNGRPRSPRSAKGFTWGYNYFVRDADLGIIWKLYIGLSQQLEKGGFGAI